MFAAAIALPALALLLWAPLLVPYLLLAYMVVNGYASRPLMMNLKLTFGGANVYPLDFLYATAVLLIPFYFIRRTLGGGARRVVSPQTRTAVILVSLYLGTYLVRFVYGVFEHVPLDSLIRMFAIDTQCIYFFLPLLFLKSEEQLRRMLYFLVAIAVLFPLGQPFLVGSDDYQLILYGQGTLRLGYGDSNVFVAIGMLAILAWERAMYMAVFPLAGIVMLAHRSAFIGLAASLAFLSYLKRKPLKMTIIAGLAGLMGAALLYVLQISTSVHVFDKGIERIGETFEGTGTTSARLHSIPQLLGVWLENPIVGLSYGELYKLQRKAEVSPGAFNILHAHNFLLTSLVQTGLVGTGLLISLIINSLMRARQLSHKTAHRETGAFLFSSLLFFVIFSLMNTTLQTAGFFFWFLSGVVFWHQNELKKQAVKQ
jgi:O-antigen ligase